MSQGVAVFYFNTKQELLAEALRVLYKRYDESWKAALAAVGPRPIDRLLAMARAKFLEEMCNSDSLILWHAYRGEAKARPHFAEIAADFDRSRYEAMQTACKEVLADLGRDDADAGGVAVAIDSLSEGLWLRPEYAEDVRAVFKAWSEASGQTPCGCRPRQRG